MFVDLDWPLNASSLLSASAELLVILLNVRMDDSRIPKQTFYGQLHHGSRRPGGQYKRYKDRPKDTLKQREITLSDLESLARDRTTWRTTCRNAVQRFEVKRVDHLVAKQQLRKTEPPLSGTFRCSTCGRMCQSRIGLFSHNKTHRSWWWDPSYRRLSP